MQKLMKQVKKPSILLKKMLFDAEHRLTNCCHTFTSNKAICSRVEYIFYKVYSCNKQSNFASLKLTARSGIIADIYHVHKFNSIHQLRFVYMYIRKVAKQIPLSPISSYLVVNNDFIS